jgi:uncharacterized protein DUF3560/antirestriction factor ArdC-like protein
MRLFQSKMDKGTRMINRQKKINPHKQLLIEKSQEAKKLKGLMIENASGQFERDAAEAIGINEILMQWYREQTGQTIFKTFHDWKKAGFKVVKGQNAYRVWSMPKKAKKSYETEQGEKLEGDEYRYWGMCCLFHAGQVEPDGDGERLGLLDVDEPSKLDLPPSVEDSIDAADIKGSPFVCSDFDERAERKVERLEDRAIKARKQANDLHKNAHDMASVIPFGQPILLGHHSEKKDRNFRAKIHKKFEKSFELDKKADELERRLNATGNTGIASDDPRALEKLKKKLEKLESSQALMKLTNKQFRLGGWDAVNCLKGNHKQKLKESMENVSYVTSPFESYSLSNNNAEINRIKKRIKELTNLYSMEPIDFNNDEFAMFVEEGQIRINFSCGKPNNQIRTLLKSYSFKWSRYFGCWVRKSTANAMYSAELLLEYLKTDSSVY